jgi:hypothetical protein
MMAEEESNRFERLVGRRLPFSPTATTLQVLVEVLELVSYLWIISLRVPCWRFLVYHMN